MSNNKRFDLSDKLIHFFRPVDLSSDNAFTAPENWGPGEIVENHVVSPMFLLRNAVRLGRIWATWSMRSGRRTIYGPHPAVCFTDMPLAAFIEFGTERARKGEAMSSYGLVFRKPALFEEGARPVIYGLSAPPRLSRDGGGPRIIPPADLPLGEQYRYVAYAPGRVDWTHEREWRWKSVQELPDREFDLPPNDGSEIPGLDLNSPLLKGLGAIVKTAQQAERLIHDVLMVTDRSGKRQSNFDFVISLDRIKPGDDLREPEKVEETIHSATFDLEPYFNLSADERTTQIANFRRAVAVSLQQKHLGMPRESGGCWLWFTDARHPMVRALVAENEVVVNRDGRYLVEIGELGRDRSLQEREGVIKHLAKLLEQRHGVRATYHSVLNSFDPDEVPHYSDPPLNDPFHFNYAHEAGDF